MSLWYIKIHQPKPKTNWLIHHERDTLIKKAVVTRQLWRVKYDTLIWTKKVHDTARFYDSSCCELLGHCAEEVDVLWAVTELDSAIISAKSDTIAAQSKELAKSSSKRKKLRKGLLIVSIAALFGIAF